MTTSATKKQGVVIVGGGPGGLAPLFAAATAGRLQELLDRGVTILEKGNRLGAGGLRNYAIRSDSTAEAILDIVTRTTEPLLRELQDHPSAKALTNAGKGSVPLSLVAEFLDVASAVMQGIVQRSASSQVLTGTAALHVRQTAHGTWITRFACGAGCDEREIESESIVLATGAEQTIDRMYDEKVAGIPLMPRFKGKLLRSDEVLAHGGAEKIQLALQGKQHPKIVIVGGSTSAGATAVSLLAQMDRVLTEPASITLMHRQPIRIFYESVEAAQAEAYDEFRAEDVCRLTGRVFRLSGFRLDSRELMMRARSIGRRETEPRVGFFSLEADNFDAANELLDQADVVIAALGYRPRVLPVFDADMRPIHLWKPSSAEWSMVDRQCRVFTEKRTPINGLYAIGLAIGPSASWENGGEAGFKGQVNSLWLWQHTLGLKIVEGICARNPRDLNGGANAAYEAAVEGVRRSLGVQEFPLRTSRAGAGTKTSARALELPDVPLIRPEPPKLSEHLDELIALEQSGIYSNYGPVNTRFERELVEQLFGEGACLTTCNATIGLMLAIREVLGEQPANRRYALMPSFTFAATAQAALWCGLTPLLCDIDPHTWLPSAAQEEELLSRYRDQIAVIVPYATFGNNLDLARYQRLSERYDVPVVVDAAASLGSLDSRGKAFGAGFAWPIVFSMHATKVFSVGEGGIIYCNDEARMQRLRNMGSFGFEQARSATMLGLNSKLSEVAALTARLQLKKLPAVVQARETLAKQYVRELSDVFEFQRQCGVRQTKSFQSLLIPASLASFRDAVVQQLRSAGIGAATYFSPHMAEQPYIRDHSVIAPLPVTKDIASRVLALPLLARMTPEQVTYVADTLRNIAGGSAFGPATTKVLVEQDADLAMIA